MNSINKFLELINKRDNLIGEHCKKQGQCWAELCNYPEERDWYCKNIVSIDYKIVKLANQIISKNKLPCDLAKTVRDVYNNHTLYCFVYNPNFYKNDLEK